VDLEGRAPTLSAPSQSRAGDRARAVLVSLGVVLLATSATSLLGCRNKEEEARQKAELTKALDQFKTQIGELQKQAVALRARLDKLPEDLPGIQVVRDNLHAVEEGIGVEDGRTKWLSGELDKAFTSGKKEDVEAVRRAIPRGNGGIDQLMLKVVHELVQFESMVSQRQYFEALDAAKARDARNERPPKGR